MERRRVPPLSAVLGGGADRLSDAPGLPQAQNARRCPHRIQRPRTGRNRRKKPHDSNVSFPGSATSGLLCVRFGHRTTPAPHQAVKFGARESVRACSYASSRRRAFLGERRRWAVSCEPAYRGSMRTLGRHYRRSGIKGPPDAVDERRHVRLYVALTVAAAPLFTTAWRNTTKPQGQTDGAPLHTGVLALQSPHIPRQRDLIMAKGFKCPKCGRSPFNPIHHCRGDRPATKEKRTTCGRPGDIRRYSTRSSRSRRNASWSLARLPITNRFRCQRIPPGNRLERLTGDRRGQYSIRVNAQWRLCFTWHEGGADDVELVDYH